MAPFKSDKNKKLKKSDNNFKVNIKYNEKDSKSGSVVKKVRKVTGKTAKIILKSILTFFLVCIITGSIVATVLAVYIMKNVDTETNIDLDNIEMAYTTIIYGTNNKGESVEITRLHANGENRIWTDLENVPLHTRYAFVCTEDKRFFEHKGVDFKRTVSAFANLFLKMYKTKQGGSTITQQLIKNLTGDDDISIERKVQEIFKSINLEKKYSKDQILEAYMNTVHFANGINGIQTASNLYFNKDVSELTIAESAAIVAITNYPTHYDPFKHPDNNKERRDFIINNMCDLGAITAEQRDQALAEELVFKKNEFKNQSNKIENYYVDQVITDVIDGLMKEKGVSYETAQSNLYSGGYRIYTALNTDIQNDLEEVYENTKNFPAYNTSKDDKENPQSAVVTIDFNGNVLGMVGGIGEKKINRGFNRAAQMTRSIGSTMKPIGAYGPAIEHDLITYSTIFEDSPYNEVKKDWPVNYYGHYKGNMTVARALQLSTNTVATKVCGLVKAQNSFDFATSRFGLDLVKYENVDGVAKSDIGIAPMSLGSLTYGVSPVALASAYQVFGNGGIYNSPKTYTKVINFENETILEKKTIEVQALSAESATVMNKLLQQVTKGSEGTGKSTQFGNWDIAAKTGTTSDNYDFWYVGMTPYYVTAVWYGYDTPKVAGKSSMITLDTWKKCMTKIHNGLPDKKFPYADTVLELKYCNKSGKIASSSCSNQLTGWYKPNNVPGVCSQCG